MFSTFSNDVKVALLTYTEGKFGEAVIEQGQIAAGYQSGIEREPEVWTAEIYTIRFRISDFCLGGVRRPALIRQTHFTDHEGAIGQLRFPEHPSGRKGLYYVPSVPAPREMPVLSLAGGMVRYCLRRYDRHVIRVEGEFERYLSKFNAKSRKTLKRKRKIWSDRCGGAAEFRVFERAAEMEQYASYCRCVSALTYQEILSGDGFPQSESFTEKLRHMAEAGRVRGYVLFDEVGRPVAYAHCVVPDRQGKVLLYDTIGYDPGERDWSPGTVLLLHILEDVYREGRFRLFDFGIGDHSYKRFFATESVWAVDLLYFPPGVANWLVAGSHYALTTVTRGVGRLVQFLGWADRLRRMLRGTVRLSSHS